MITKWLESTVGQAAPKTWNNLRGDIAAFFVWCSIPPRRWIREVPTEFIIIKPLVNRTPKIISVDTAVALMAEVEELDSGSFALLVAFLLFLGIRPDTQDGEIQRIAEEIKSGMVTGEFKITNRQVFLGPSITKTKTPRWIDLPENMKCWLQAYPPKPANFNIVAYSASGRRLRKKHKIPHDALRHSFCSYCTKKFGPAEAATAAGHSEIMQRKRYLNGAISPEEAAAFFAIMPTKSRTHVA